jgi:hypothetical protein
LVILKETYSKWKKNLKYIQKLAMMEQPDWLVATE